jgi:hypothetical protein
MWVAVEDDGGYGAAVAAAWVLPDGRIEVDGWLFDDWDTALDHVGDLSAVRQIRQLLVGASVLTRVPPGTVPAPEPAGTRETRVGLALFRDLVLGGELVHDNTLQLDAAVDAARVRETETGLVLVRGHGPTHLVKAVVWALAAAHKPAPIARVY